MTMDCGQAAERITRTLSGNASAAEEADLQRHLLACPPCRETEARLSRVWSLMGRLPQVALSREKVAVLADGIARVRAARRLPWAAGLAAGALLAIGLFLLLRSPGQTPRVESPNAKIISPAAPEEPKRETAHEEVERGRVEQLLTEKTPGKTVEIPVPQAPDVPEPRKVVVPAPVVKTPETPAPPKPEPREVVRETPAAPVKPVPPERETLRTAATLNRAEGTVLLVTATGKSPARAGQAIPAGAGVETAGVGSQAVFEYEDGTRVALGADTVLGQVWDRRSPSGKGPEGKLIVVSHGILAAQVAKQPATEPMLFVTPQAEAKVLGTRLSLTVTPATTRLHVRQGRVRLTRKDDGAWADVSEGRFAVAGKGIAPSAKAAPGPRIILLEPFAGAKWNPALAQGGDSGTGLRFSTETGALSVHAAQKAPPEVVPAIVAPSTPNSAGKIPPDVAKKVVESVVRGAALGAKGDLPRALWLETRQTFALANDTPLRIRARLWQSHSDADRSSWISLNRATPGQALLLERRGDVLQLWSEAAQAAVWKKELSCVQEWESLELWLSRDQIVVRRNDRTVYSGANPLKVKVVQIAFGSNAKAELPRDEESRFDDFELSWTTRADFEDVTR